MGRNIEELLEVLNDRFPELIMAEKLLEASVDSLKGEEITMVEEAEAEQQQIVRQVVQHQHHKSIVSECRSSANGSIMPGTDFASDPERTERAKWSAKQEPETQEAAKNGHTFHVLTHL